MCFISDEAENRKEEVADVLEFWIKFCFYWTDEKGTIVQ
jgi:hypothetical protein